MDITTFIRVWLGILLALFGGGAMLLMFWRSRLSRKMRNVLRGLLFAGITFAVVVVPTYIGMFHLMSLDSLTPEDSPAAVLGVVLCVVRTLAISTFAAIVTFLVTIVRGRKHASKFEVGV